MVLWMFIVRIPKVTEVKEHMTGSNALQLGLKRVLCETLKVKLNFHQRHQGARISRTVWCLLMKCTFIELSTRENVHVPQVAEAEEWASNLLGYQIMASGFLARGSVEFQSCFDLIFSWYSYIQPIYVHRRRHACCQIAVASFPSSQCLWSLIYLYRLI